LTGTVGIFKFHFLYKINSFLFVFIHTLKRQSISLLCSNIRMARHERNACKSTKNQASAKAKTTAICQQQPGRGHPRLWNG
jgi:hypothetical protein